MDSPVSYEFSDGIATLTMDDGKANALNVTMLQAINAALDHAEDDKAVVVLTGRERMFSGGFDLGAFKRGPEEVLQMLEAGARLSERLVAFPRPVIAACGGHAVAMGVFLLLSSDVRIGVEGEFRYHVNEVQIGMTVPHFAIEVCRQRLAPAHLHLAVTTATPYSPAQALAAGFLDALVAPEVLAQTARSRAEALVKLPAGSFAATKLRLRKNGLDALRQAVRDDIADWAAGFGQRV